jgi:CDP-diacylglycerol--glycerol-3-phosphate 3-phosphatidyltransferase
MKHLPNALTLLRLVLAPVVTYFFAWGAAGGAYTDFIDLGADYEARDSAVAFYLNGALVLFIVAALTDLLDGMAARAFNAHSKFGRLIDPIADKALVGLPLLAIALFGIPIGMTIPLVSLSEASILAILVIVARDVTMTVVRLRAPDGEGARVSQLAKIKTALELVLIASFFAFCAYRAQRVLPFDDAAALEWLTNVEQIFVLVWQVALAITAALSAWTAFQYLRPAKTIP